MAVFNRKANDNINDGLEKTTSGGQNTTSKEMDNNRAADVARKLNKPPSKKRFLAIALLVLLLGGALVVGLRSKNKKNEANPVVFSIDSREFRASEVNGYLDLATNNYNLDKTEAQKSLIEAMKLKIAAEKLKIDISDAKIREALQITSYAKIAEVKGELDRWVGIIGFRLAMENYIETQQAQAKQGYSYVFYFASLTIPDYSGENIDNFGNKELIKRDKDYAHKKAEEYHKALAEGKSTPNQVLKQVVADKQLNYRYIPDFSYSKNFGHNKDPDETWQSEVFFQDIVKYVDSYSEAKKPSDIKTGKIAKVPDPKKDQDYVDAYYYFVYLTSGSNPSAQVKSTVDNMKVVTH